MTMKILLVEDDAALRAALVELLHREGYEVKKAANFREARAGLDGSIDLVMLDVGLPDGDGVSLCKAWRSEGVQTPILFLTAKDDELDVVRGLDAGGNDYVTKPFRMQELLSRIRAQLRRNQPEISRSSERKERMQLLAVRAIWIFALVLLHEIILLIYQYFSTAIFEWKYVRYLVIRVAETVALCLLLYQPFHYIFIGRADQAHSSRTTREVKHF
jgi:CheY-like chemotaxis protein